MTLSGSTGHHWIEIVDKRFMMLTAKCSLLMLKACAKPRRLSDHTNSGESHSRKESGRFSRNRDSPCQDRREKTLCGEEEVR
jgi:hypothetical protein